VNGLKGIMKDVVNLALMDGVMNASFMKMWHLIDNYSTLRYSKWILLMESTKMDGWFCSRCLTETTSKRVLLKIAVASNITKLHPRKERSYVVHPDTHTHTHTYTHTHTHTESHFLGSSCTLSSPLIGSRSLLINPHGLFPATHQ